MSGKFGFGIAFGESRLPAAVISRKEEAEKSILQEGVYIFSKSGEGRQYDTKAFFITNSFTFCSLFSFYPIIPFQDLMKFLNGGMCNE